MIPASKRCAAEPQLECPLVARPQRTAIRMDRGDLPRRLPHGTDDPLTITSDDAIPVADWLVPHAHRVMARGSFRDFRPFFVLTCHHGMAGCRRRIYLQVDSI